MVSAISKMRLCKYMNEYLLLAINASAFRVLKIAIDLKSKFKLRLELKIKVKAKWSSKLEV